MRNSEGQAKTLWLGHSPFTFTVHRDKDSSFLGIAMGKDNYFPIWLLWGRITLRFEIWGRMKWRIPVSDTQEAELCSGSAGEGAGGLLNLCMSGNGKALVDAPRGETRDVVTGAAKLQAPLLPPVLTWSQKVSENLKTFSFQRPTQHMSTLDRVKRLERLWLLFSGRCHEVPGFCSGQWLPETQRI